MRFVSLASVLVMVVVSALAVQTMAQAQKAKKEPIVLFDGKTLNGWKVIGCEAEVQDGCILMKSGNGVVRPDRTFKDFVLEMEWKALKSDNWDSGIYIRCKDPQGTYPWPRVWQVNLLKGQEGNISELKDARSTGMIKAGEWNHFKLTVAGTKAELEINGKPAWKADGLKDPEGFISFQAEVPKGGQFLFRNLKLLELDGQN